MLDFRYIALLLSLGFQRSPQPESGIASQATVKQLRTKQPFDFIQFV